MLENVRELKRAIIVCPELKAILRKADVLSKEIREEQQIENLLEFLFEEKIIQAKNSTSA